MQLLKVGMEEVSLGLALLNSCILSYSVLLVASNVSVLGFFHGMITV